MPWNVGQKKFIRNNGRNEGPIIWDQDAVAGQVIDSSGHDTQDQDIADGITETLNINGINEMLADLKFNTHKAVGMGPGTAGTDGANKDQLDVVDAKAEANAIQISNNTDAINVNGVQISNNIGGINTNAGNIATNAAAILVNEGDISTNATNIQNNTDAIAGIEGTNKSAATVATAPSTIIDMASDDSIYIYLNDAPTTIDVILDNLPDTDPALGSVYSVTVEVQIINGTTPGAIGLAISTDVGQTLVTTRFFGTQNVTPGVPNWDKMTITATTTGSGNWYVVWSFLA